MTGIAIGHCSMLALCERLTVLCDLCPEKPSLGGGIAYNVLSICNYF